MEQKISLNNFLSDNDKLFVAYCFFLGFLAFSLNIENTTLKLDFATYFFSLAILFWMLPLIPAFKRINILRLDLLLYILLTTVGNFTIAKSILASFNPVLIISKIIYIFSIACMMTAFYFGISSWNYKIKTHRKYFFLFLFLTIVLLVIWGIHRYHYVLPIMQQEVGS